MRTGKEDVECIPPELHKETERSTCLALYFRLNSKLVAPVENILIFSNVLHSIHPNYFEQINLC